MAKIEIIREGDGTHKRPKDHKFTESISPRDESKYGLEGMVFVSEYSAIYHFYYKCSCGAIKSITTGGLI